MALRPSLLAGLPLSQVKLSALSGRRQFWDLPKIDWFQVPSANCVSELRRHPAEQGRWRLSNVSVTQARTVDLDSPS